MQNRIRIDARNPAIPPRNATRLLRKKKEVVVLILNQTVWVWVLELPYLVLVSLYMFLVGSYSEWGTVAPPRHGV